MVSLGGLLFTLLQVEAILSSIRSAMKGEGLAWGKWRKVAGPALMLLILALAILMFATERLLPSLHAPIVAALIGIAIVGTLPCHLTIRRWEKRHRLVFIIEGKVMKPIKTGREEETGKEDTPPAQRREQRRGGGEEKPAARSGE